MNRYLNQNEQELIKLIKFFSKRAAQLIQDGALSEEHQELSTACQRLTDQVYRHAAAREQITQKREKLKAIIKDNAICPKCQLSSHLKLLGATHTEQGWKSNKYKCRRCNIEFVWTKPNNPWDMVTFLENYILEMEANTHNEALPHEIRQQSAQVIEQLQVSLDQLKPVLAGSDQELADLETTELEMSKMVHQFKNYLLIEKIKLDTWQDPRPGKK